MKTNFVLGVLIFSIFLIQIFLILDSTQISLSPDANFYVRRVLPISFVKGQAFEVALEITPENGFLFENNSFFLAELANNARIISAIGNLSPIIEEDLIFWKKLSPEKYSLVYSVVSNEDRVNFNGRWEFNLSGEEIGDSVYSGFVVGDSEIFSYDEIDNPQTSGGSGSSKNTNNLKNISGNQTNSTIYPDGIFEEQATNQSGISSEISKDSYEKGIFILIIILAVFIFLVLIRKRFKSVKSL